jgi:hypothetical protein
MDSLFGTQCVSKSEAAKARSRLGAGMLGGKSQQCVKENRSTATVVGTYGEEDSTEQIRKG